jgi:type II secretory pathway component PulK
MLLRPEATAVVAAFVRLAEARGIDPATTDTILEYYADLRESPATGPGRAGASFASWEPVLAAELAAVPGVIALDVLLPAISLLPEPAGVNLNTAREDVVLALLGDAADASGWDAFEAARGEQPMSSIEEALEAVSVHFGQAVAAGLDRKSVTTYSDWFELRARVRQEDGSSAATFLLHRSGSPAATEVIARIPVDG